MLVIIVLVLLAVALWQLTKIFDLTQVGSKSDDSQIATDNDNNIGVDNITGADSKVNKNSDDNSSENDFRRHLR